MTLHDAEGPPNLHFLSYSGFRRTADKMTVLSHVLPLKAKLWLGPESNRRHADFQSAALPTELPSRDGADRVALWGVHYAAI